jgi:hypothetical protein
MIIPYMHAGYIRHFIENKYFMRKHFYRSNDALQEVLGHTLANLG